MHLHTRRHARLLVSLASTTFCIALSAQVAAPPPVLYSVAPAAIPQNAQHMRLTLLGSDFRPGLQVWISAPLVDNTLTVPRAEDVLIESVLYVNSNTLVVTFSARADAALGTREVNVVNSDGTNTGSDIDFAFSDTAQPLETIPSQSLAAPLQAQTLALTHPRDGTSVGQGDQLFAEAIIAGVGSGTITGEWIWDGATTEQFSLVMSGSQPVSIRTNRSLPTILLGAHRLALRITSPNLMQSRSVTLVVNPSGWSLQRLLWPPSRTLFAADAPPVLRWAIVPGAATYQVGFASRPYLSSVQHWYNVQDTEWQVPSNIWSGLPEGELFWTVRVAETSGVMRRPPPMRRIFRAPKGILQPLRTTPRMGARGAPLLAWQGLEQPALYRVTISRDPQGKDVVGSYYTPRAEVDLWSIGDRLEPGKAYYWRVDALTPEGEPVLTAPAHEFIAGPERHIGILRGAHTLDVASLGIGFAPPPPADLVQTRVPGPGETVTQSQPEIRLQLKSAVAAGLTAITVDNVDVTGVAVFTTDTIIVTPPAPLSNGEHKIILQVDQDTQEWSFNVDAPPRSTPPAAQNTGETSVAYQSGTDAEAEPSETQQPIAAKLPGGKTGTPWQTDFDTQISSTTQWASGNDSGEEDTNVTSVASRIAYQNNFWRFEQNGSGLLNSILAPEPRHALNRINDHVLRLSHKGKPWGGELSFGILAPSLYTNSEFVTTATPRQGVEPLLRTPAGNLGFYANTDDLALGGGSGVAFHQRILGAGYTAPLPPDRFKFRLMWLNAGDKGAPTTIVFTPGGTPVQSNTPLATPARGDAYGGLLQLQFAPGWTWNSEYAWSQNNPDTTSAIGRLFGRAWRTGVIGTYRKTGLSVVYRDVSRNFGSPANPALSAGSSPGRRQVDVGATQITGIGSFNAAYQLMQSDVKSPNRPTVTLHSGRLDWSKDLTDTTIIGLNGHYMRTSSGDLPKAVLYLPPAQLEALKADLRDAGLGGDITQRVGAVSLSFQATRDWFRNNIVTGANTITSTLNGGASWRTASWFQIQSNLGVSWVAANPILVGTQRLITAYIQPMFLSQRTGISVAPLITINNTKSKLASGTSIADSSNVDAGGRLGWQMPGALHISTLAIQGDWTRSRDMILGTEMRDSRAALVWTISWGHSRNRAGGLQ